MPWGASALLGPFPRPAPKVRPSVPPSGLGPDRFAAMPPLATWMRYVRSTTSTTTQEPCTARPNGRSHRRDDLLLLRAPGTVVTEMAKTREPAMPCRNSLWSVRRLGPAVVVVAVKNVGPGPALDVDARVIDAPMRPRVPRSGAGGGDMLASGEPARLLSARLSSTTTINTLTATYREHSTRRFDEGRHRQGVRGERVVRGSARARRTVLHEAVELWEPEAGQRMARELGKGSSGRSRRWQPASRESATAVRDLGARRGESPNPDD